MQAIIAPKQNAPEIIAFYNWHDPPRFAVRYAIDWLDGEIMGYGGTGLQVRMPEAPHKRRALKELLIAAGLKQEQDFYFPIGAENVPKTMRHRGPSQTLKDEPGYTYNIHFHPIDNRNAPYVHHD